MWKKERKKEKDRRIYKIEKEIKLFANISKILTLKIY